MPTETWAALSSKRRALARLVYQRDRATIGYLCPGAPGKPCGQPIDWDLPYKDPHTGQVNVWSKSVDHCIEIQDGGAMLDLDNCWTTHLHCNSSKGAARRWQREREARYLHNYIAIDPRTI